MSKGGGLSRREFFRTGGLVGAGAVLPIGRSRVGVVLKSLIPPENIIPGRSYWFPSTCGECHAGCGVKVRVRDGNAVKIEGNESHPINHGGLCARGQSALQALYSPARIRSPLERSAGETLEQASWEDAGNALAARLRKLAGDSENKLVVVTSQVTGAMRATLEAGTAGSSRTGFIVHEPLEYAATAAANRLCFGIEAVPTHDLSGARAIVSFGADLFETWLSPVSNAHGFAESRRLKGGTMSRLMQFESHLSLTGANADDRYAVPPGAETLIALATASLMLSDGALPDTQLKQWRAALVAFDVERAAKASGLPPETIRNMAYRLKTQTPSLVVAGGSSARSPNATALQVTVNLINTLAGNYGNTITFDRTENAPLGTHAQMMRLVEDMEAGRVAALVVHETNIEFAFPQPERLAAAMQRVPLKIQLAAVRDASSGQFDFVLPAHHWLESWDLLEPRSGLHCLRQPAIGPWLDSRHPGQIIADILRAWTNSPQSPQEPPEDYDKSLRERWDGIRLRDNVEDGFKDFWRGVLSDGGYWARPTPRDVTLDAGAAAALSGIDPATFEVSGPTLLPVPTVRYGSGQQTGRPWLHELPDPVTTIMWDAPMLISPATARKWKCRSGDVIELEIEGGGNLKAPVFVQAGIDDGGVVAPLGTPSDKHLAHHYSADGHPLHRLSGNVDEASGALVWTGEIVSFKRVAGKIRLARAQGHSRQDGRGIARAIAISDVGKPAQDERSGPDAYEWDLYPKHEHPVHDWSMVIDLSACIGCGACVTACHAENNVPVVGKGQCLLGRELSWLRIERFIDRGRIVFLPMLCQQCEHAPCETVCPVYATVHSSEGLNVQVYNRCVGTRYCANNCPYKVRRFNWYTYKIEPPLDKQLSPDISIRTRGIMEKCTFCIQRIREHKETAKDEKRPVRDGEIIPACAQSCPTRAITFGDLNDRASKVSSLMSDPRGYAIFSHLNTQPSVVYLKRIYHDDSIPVESL